jgi:glycosyltransferase involved in cell wall biosynthesis
MRIGLFTDTFRPNLNGVTVSIETFAAELAHLGSTVVLFAPRPRFPRPFGSRFGSAVPPISHPPGVDSVHWVPSVPLVFERTQRLALPLERLIVSSARRARLDVVHTQTPFGIGYAGVQAGRALGIPVVHTYHTYYAEYVHYLRAGARLARRLTPAVSRWFCNLHDWVIVPSHDIEDLLAGYGVRRPLEVLMTGVPIPPVATPEERVLARRELGLAPEERALLFVGRIAREKNLDLLLDAMPELLARDPRLVLFLAGDGPDRLRLERAVVARGLAREVRFLGWVPHDAIEPCYRAADVFVFPSLTETQGLALLEAMARGCAVVAAHGPGVRELIDHGVNGLLAAPEPRAFARAVTVLLARPQLARRLGESARRRAGDLESAGQARTLLERYEELQAQARGVRRGLRGLAARAREEVAAWR